MTDNVSRPVNVYILLGAIVFQGLSGLLGGIGLVLDPTGESLQIPLSWLEGSPFDDYLVPGLILFFILGIFPLVVFYGLLKKTKWSWFAAMLVGVGLVIWIVVEILVIGYQPQPPLQAIYGVLGLIILVSVLSPPTRRFYKTEK
jgi:peptidoglycan/LPS O-acetylase OafA/YrhL